MKKVLIILSILIMPALVFASGAGENTMSELTYFSYSHSGMYRESCYTYTFTDSQYLGFLEAMVTDHNVKKWNGFSKTNSMVLDGESFSLSLKFSDGSTVNASGSNSYPDGYRAFIENFESFIAENGILPDMDEWSESEFLTGSENLCHKWSTDYSLSINGKYFNDGNDLYLCDNGKLLLVTYTYSGPGRENCYKCIDQFFIGSWSEDNERLTLSIPELEYDFSSDYRIEKTEYGTYLRFMTGNFYAQVLEENGSSVYSTSKADLLGQWYGATATEWDCYSNSSGAWYSVYCQGASWTFTDSYSYYMGLRNETYATALEASIYTYENGKFVQELPDGDVYAYEMEIFGDHLLAHSLDDDSYFLMQKQDTTKVYDCSLQKLKGTWVNENEAGRTTLTFFDDHYILTKERNGQVTEVTCPFEFGYGELMTEEYYEPYLICNDKLYYFITDYTAEVDKDILFTFEFDLSASN